MEDLLQDIDKQGVCHTAALPFTLKSKYLKAKEELWKLKYFTIHAKIKPSKSSSKRNQSPSRYCYNSITNLKFQHKPKCHLSKIFI
jgi:hypothetical protein